MLVMQSLKMLKLLPQSVVTLHMLHIRYLLVAKVKDKKGAMHVPLLAKDIMLVQWVLAQVYMKMK